jgi:uncharacterized OsmC-like protein
MPTSTIQYLGNLRTESTHVASGASILTDAPVDNHGLGSQFSPTDMVANSLATCMLTVMGIKANDMGILFDGSTAEVTKVMASDPRRIGKIQVVFQMKVSELNNKIQTILENTAKTCPVHYSLHPDIEREITFHWELQSE